MKDVKTSSGNVAFPTKAVFLIAVCALTVSVILLRGINSKSAAFHESFEQIGAQGIAEDETITTWEDRALNIQTEIDNSAVLSQSFWVGCHNAFANSHDAPGISDPNQPMSIRKQLETGAREFSLDLYKPLGKKNIRVCHAHCTVATGDALFKDILKIYSNWLSNNRRAVVLLKLEVGKNAEDNRKKLAKDIRDKIGGYVYQTGSTNRAAIPIPAATLRKQDVLDAGKNVLIYVYNHEKETENSELFNQYVFYKGSEAEDAGEPSKVPQNGDEDGILYRVKMGETKDGLLSGEVVDKTVKQVTKVAKKGAKAAKKLFKRKRKRKRKKKKKNTMVLRSLASVGGVRVQPALAALKVSRENIGEWLSSGINIVELYGFNAQNNDWKHGGTAPCLARDMVWSWDETSRQPIQNSANSVAILSSATNRFHSAASGTSVRCACRKSDGSWGITSQALVIRDSVLSNQGITDLCVSDYGTGAKFACPMMKNELDDLVAARGVSESIGLNYIKAGGHWVANS